MLTVNVYDDDCVDNGLENLPAQPPQSILIHVEPLQVRQARQRLGMQELDLIFHQIQKAYVVVVGGESVLLHSGDVVASDVELAELRHVSQRQRGNFLQLVVA